MAERAERVPVRTIATTIGMVLVAAVAVLVIFEVRRVLIWLAIAGFFAVALYPVTNWTQRLVRRRTVATLLVFLVTGIVLAGLVAAFVIPLARQGSQLAVQLPDIVRDAQAGRGPVGDLLARLHLQQYVQQHADRVQALVSGLGRPALNLLKAAVTTVVGIVTITVLAYLIVLEGPLLVNGTLALMPERRAERVRRVGADCAKTVTGYIGGNVLISVICGLATFLVLLLLGIPFAGLIALFVAIADLIPLIGATLGAVVAALAGFIHSVPAGIVVIVFFVVYQQLENHVLQPLILSRTVRLNPLTVLVSILIGVELAGLVGALLAIPVAGMIQVVVRDIWDTRRGRPKPEPTVGEEEVPVGRAARHDGSAPPHPS
jgi:predicted PurR-regulated permease PerM